MATLKLVPLDDVAVFPGMPVTLSADVGTEQRVLLVPQRGNRYAKVGVVAANAPNGGLRANEVGNALTIAFGQNSDDAIQIAGAFKRFAPKKLKPHITDVMRTEKNAVLLWTVTPPQEELDKVVACLKG